MHLLPSSLYVHCVAPSLFLLPVPHLCHALTCPRAFAHAIVFTGKCFCSLRAQLSNSFLRESFTELPNQSKNVISSRATNFYFVVLAIGAILHLFWGDYGLNVSLLNAKSSLRPRTISVLLLIIISPSV